MQSAIEIRYASESKFNRYAQLVERNLQSFDTVSEWADVISFLGKLLKAFQSFEFPVIPHKLVVTKRLAQCLNPALPTGVHQKTLEVYAYILKKIGPDQLAYDLSLYAYGLFPFLQHAATSVKPQLLNLFSEYFLSLGQHLCPCLQSLLLALLPGLDEEGSEYFPQVMTLFDKIAKQVGISMFYEALWHCLLASDQCRNSGLHYLGRRLPKLEHGEEVMTYLGHDMTLVVRAIEASLVDTDTLVQRGMLDLLVNRFPLHRQLFNEAQLTALMVAALSTVLRRDMSLNRRLYTWLLGSDEERGKQQVYFDTYARKAASKALSQLLYAEEDLTTLQRPFKIIISLLDKWELGQPMVKETLLDVMISLRLHVTSQSTLTDEEANLIKTANMLFDVLEPWQIWSTIARLVNANETAHVNKEWIHVIEFLLLMLNTADPEIRDVQLPCMVLFVLCKLSVMVDTPGFDLAGASNLSRLAAQLIGRVSVNAFKRTTGSGDWAKLVTQKETQIQQQQDSTSINSNDHTAVASPTTWHSAQDIFDGLWAYYQADTDPSQIALPDGVTLLRMALQCMEALLTSLCSRSMAYEPSSNNEQNTRVTMVNVMAVVLDQHTISTETAKESNQHSLKMSDLFVGLCQTYEWLVKMRGQLVESDRRSITTVEENEPSDLSSSNGNKQQHQSKRNLRHHGRLPLKSLTERRQDALFLLLINTSCKMSEFNSITAALSVASVMVQEHYVDVLNNTSMPWLGSAIVKLWSFLSPNQLWLHERAIQLIWTYVDLVGSSAVEAILLPFIQSASSIEQQVVALSHFCVFWRLSSDQHLPQLSFQTVLFSILDRVYDHHVDARLRHAAQSWLQANLENAHCWLDPFLLILMDAEDDWRRIDESHQHYSGGGISSKGSPIGHSREITEFSFDDAQVAYAFRLVGKLLASTELNGDMMMMMMHRRVTSQVLQRATRHEHQQDKTEDKTSPSTYFDLWLAQSFKYCIGTRARLLDQDPELQPIQAYALQLALLLTRQTSERLATTQLLPTALYEVASTLSRHVSHGKQQSQQPLLLRLMLQLLQQSNGNQHDGVDEYNGVVSLEWMVLLSQAALEAIASPASRSVLRNWIDFIPKAARLHEDAKVNLVLPSLNRFCQELARTSSQTAENIGTDSSWDLDTLLDGLEEFVVGCLDETVTSTAYAHLSSNLHTSLSNDGSIAQQQQQQQQQQHASSDKLRDIVLSQLPVVIQVAIDVWQTIGGWLPVNEQKTEKEGPTRRRSSAASSLQLTMISMAMHDATKSRTLMPWQSQRIRNRILSFIEHLGVLCRDPTTSALLDVWSMNNSNAIGEDVMSITSQLTSIRPAFVFKKLFKRIKTSSHYGTSGSSGSSSGNHANNTSGSPSHHSPMIPAQQLQQPPTSTSTSASISHQRHNASHYHEASSFVVCFDFLSRYCLLVETGEWAVLWPRTIEFIRELISQGNRTRPFWIACLQYFITAWEKTNQSTSVGHANATAETQLQSAAEDLCIRLVEICLLSSSVPPSQKRRNHHHEEAVSPDDDMLRPALSGTILEKRLAYRLHGSDIDSKLLYFVSQVLLPAMVERFNDQERVHNTLALILHQAILPILRKGTSGQKDAALDALVGISQHPQGIKVLRKDAWDLFLDNSFFPMSTTTAAPRWTRIIGRLMASERERITELLGRISTFSGATTLFTNRETEALGRAQALRRFAFAVYCGKPGQYLPQLPSMQEKLVELMKLPSNNIVHVEMYLVLSVLFCRIPSQNLANFLPVLITETRRLFLQVYLDKEIDIGLTNVVLAACKFIDLLFSLNPKEFRIHQWIFVAESDAINGQVDGADKERNSTATTNNNNSQSWQQPGLFDLLAKRYSSSIPSEADFLVTTRPYESTHCLQRRPMISLHRIDDLRELGAFFRQIGEHTRRMTLSLAKPDMTAIETNLLEDLAYPVESIKR
ncbi:Dopey, N-terminal-domain-containing protein [Syncephalis plumigaleata]|nr:Dopey, N-terminal-domain-containing protein [Syncephalis plumigaleata]